MLGSRHRFHGHGSLRFVYSKGQVVRSKYAVCKYTHNPRRSDARVAVVISKKVVKSAVRRNRIRRRMYEIIRAELPNIKPQTDLVYIIVSPEVLTASFDEMTAAVQRTLASANLYNLAKN